MFEKRPMWGLILGLNVCILIWMMSVQEPVIFEANTVPLNGANNYVINTASGSDSGSQMVADLVNQQPQGVNVWGRDSLSKEYMDDMPAAGSTLTTLNLSNNPKSNSSSISKSSTSSHSFAVKTTAKTSDLSSDIQMLTSSLGTGVLELKSKPTPSWTTLVAVGPRLPDEDFNQLIDLQNFQFLMAQPVCGSYIEALILIHSAPKNHEKRQIIRETWASISHHTTEFPLRILFLLGRVNSQQLQEDLEKENNLHRDLIQGSFVDDYRNMTYKHVMAFKWFLYNCPQAQILIKVDDDVYVNTPQLLMYLKGHQPSQTQHHKIMNKANNDNPTIAITETLNRTVTGTTTSSSSSSSTTPTNNANPAALSFFSKLNIFASNSATATPSTPTFNASQELFNHPKNLLFCQKIIGSLVKRSYRSKWRVSFKEYAERYYPPYCPGYAIIYSPDVIFRLYTAAQNSKYFWIDDVHITGVLAQQTNTTITTSSHYVLYSNECDELLTGKTDLSKTEFLFAWHSISAQQIKLLWHLQMMSIQTPDDLHYTKVALDGGHANQGKQQQEQRHPLTKTDEYFGDNEISSSYAYTSANGFR